MGVLSAFLNPEPMEQEKKVIVSNRFKDENGQVVPFIIKSISQDVNERLTKKCTTTKTVKGQTVKNFDTARYTSALMVECCVQPDFADADLCKRYGCIDPLDVPARMLTSGEYTRLGEEIMSINGYDIDPVTKAEEEAKN